MDNPTHDRNEPRPLGDARAPSGRRGTCVRLFLTCWIVYVLHFATNTVREIYPALGLADHLSFDVREYTGFHPDIFVPFPSRDPAFQSRDREVAVTASTSAPSHPVAPLPHGRGSEKRGRGSQNHGGAAFINNNPGASIVGAIPYVLCKPVVDRIIDRVQRQRAAHPTTQAAAFDSPWPMAREFHRKARERGFDIKFGLAAAIMQALAMAPLSALAAVVMFRILECRTQSPRAALWLALLYAFATPVFYRTAQLNQNLLVAHAALFAFVLLWRPGNAAARPAFLAAGLLCGFAVLCDYSGLVVVLALGLYAVARARRAADILRFAAGVAVFGAMLMAYQWSCFGHPLYPAQHYMPPAHFTERGYQGFDWPAGDLLWKTTFGMQYGLFASAPLLLLALWIPGWLGGGARVHSEPNSSAEPGAAGRLLGPREIALAVGFTLAFLIFCSANQYGRMQFNCGVRHVVPIAPFVFLLAATVLLRLPRAASIAVAIPALYWSWCLTMYRDVERGSGILEALKHISFGGPRLPWLDTLARMGPPFSTYAASALSPALILLAAAVVIAVMWRGQAPLARNRSQ